jgi:tripartite-type tricarboxylate transporter receptor subunit TctC
VNANSPWQTAKDMLDAVAKDPTKYKYGTQSPAGPSTIGTYQIMKGAGIDPTKPTKVVFGGGGPVVTALAGGNVDWSVNSISEVQSLVEAKNLRVLAVSGLDTRAKQLPNSPLAKEAGVPWFTFVGYTGVWGPPKLPDPIVQKWADAIKAAQTDKDFLAKMDTAGAYPAYLGPADFKVYLKGQYDEAVQIVKDLKLSN